MSSCRFAVVTRTMYRGMTPAETRSLQDVVLTRPTRKMASGSSAQPVGTVHRQGRAERFLEEPQANQAGAPPRGTRAPKLLLAVCGPRATFSPRVERRGTHCIFK